MTAIVYPCDDRSASDVASELARRGVAEVSSIAALAGTKPAPRQGRRGQPTIAIDGCALACATRSLSARGPLPFASVRLDDPALPPSRRRQAAIERVRRELRLLADADPGSCDPAPVDRPRSKRGGPGLAFLGAISFLSECRIESGETETAVSAAGLARLFGVSRASAGETLARLERDGLVARAGGRRVILTAAGRQVAEHSRRRSVAAERFLVEFVGCSPDEARAYAVPLAATIDDEMAERLETALGTSGQTVAVVKASSGSRSTDASALVERTALARAERRAQLL